jgi:hypothetical protein
MDLIDDDNFTLGDDDGPRRRATGLRRSGLNAPGPLENGLSSYRRCERDQHARDPRHSTDALHDGLREVGSGRLLREGYATA